MCLPRAREEEEAVDPTYVCVSVFLELEEKTGTLNEVCNNDFRTSVGRRLPRRGVSLYELGHKKEALSFTQTHAPSPFDSGRTKA